MKFKEKFGQISIRMKDSDGDPDMEAQFSVPVKIKIPAVFTENLFMDNAEECKNLLMTEEGKDHMVQTHFSAIPEMEEDKPISSSYDRKSSGQSKSNPGKGYSCCS
jgi:hypothetical protein